MKFLKTIKIALIPKIIVCFLLVAAPFSSLMVQSILIFVETSQIQIKVLFCPISMFAYIISVMAFIIGLVRISAQKQSR